LRLSVHWRNSYSVLPWLFFENWVEKQQIKTTPRKLSCGYRIIEQGYWVGKLFPCLAIYLSIHP